MVFGRGLKSDYTPTVKASVGGKRAPAVDRLYQQTLSKSSNGITYLTICCPPCENAMQCGSLCGAKKSGS